jgi:nicotinate-nucleotide--dimethylbenzimidazole phosphoribosyltransferase
LIRNGDPDEAARMSPPAPDAMAPDPLSDLLASDAPAILPEATRRAIYDVIALRRDIRHFEPGREVDEATLARILGAAHLAPSVGFSQPWHFIVIRDRAIRQQVRSSFLACRQTEAARFPAERREEYLRHKLEGIEEAPLNLCVAVDLRDQGEAILGTTVQPEAVRASACCAVQNLWLAARAEGIGVGWVSIVEPAVLRAALQLPAGVEPIAYLCVGHPVAFRRRPMLDETGWAPRRPLAEAIHRDRFDATAAAARANDVGPTARTRAPAVPSPGVPPFDEAAQRAALAHQDTLVKPIGSLGRLEELAARYAGARGRFPAPIPQKAALALFAADHGVAAEGVSAYGSQTTAAMIATVMAGGAAVNVLARQHEIDLTLVDVGVAGDLSAIPRQPLVPLLRHPVRAGTRNLRTEAALTADEVNRARAIGAQIAARLIEQGHTLVGVGEIGIGNTTSAAALIALFTGRDPGDIVGRGTGLDDAGIAHKIAVVRAALALHRLSDEASGAVDPLHALAAVGGLEIAAMVGFIIAAASQRCLVVLDGVVTNAGALAACALAPGLAPYLVAAHRSAERGADHALAALGLQPLLDFGLRLGEGTGAILAMDLVRTAVAAQGAMATFATAGIVRPAI